VRLVHGYGVLTLGRAISLLVIVRLWHGEHSVGDIENNTGMIQLFYRNLKSSCDTL
jgi:hypothetical protein